MAYKLTMYDVATTMELLKYVSMCRQCASYEGFQHTAILFNYRELFGNNRIVKKHTYELVGISYSELVK